MPFHHLRRRKVGCQESGGISDEGRFAIEKVSILHLHPPIHHDNPWYWSCLSIEKPYHKDCFSELSAVYLANGFYWWMLNDGRKPAVLQVDLKSFVDEVIAKVERKVGMPQGGEISHRNSWNKTNEYHVEDLVYTL